MKKNIKQTHLKKAFTLIELITCITIIAILLSILMPALTMARNSAHKIYCSSNLKNLGLAMRLYSNDFRTLPATYYFGKNTTNSEKKQIVHFSGILLQLQYSNEKAFHCKAIDHGGHPASEENDTQAQNCAFTLNEALCPRGRFEIGSDGALRASRHVRPERIKAPANVILATEWTKNASAITDSDGFIMSYLPIHAVRVIGSANDKYDVNKASDETDKPCFKNGLLRYLKLCNISKTQEKLLANPSRLDWVGRNHGSRNNPTSNFLYLDSHVENKTVFKTLSNLQWGNRFYSLSGDNRIQH